MSKKYYIYAEVPEAIKKKAIRLAKKSDQSFRQWIKQLIKDAD